MRIAVCIKQVPDTHRGPHGPGQGTLIREGVASIVNPFDTYALEEGVRLKEKHGGTVTAVTMARRRPRRRCATAWPWAPTRRCWSPTAPSPGSDTWATSLTLAGAAAQDRLRPHHLRQAGHRRRHRPGGTGAGRAPGVAQATYVKKIREVTRSGWSSSAWSRRGVEIAAVPLPALITVVKEINEPRLPSLKGQRCAPRRSRSGDHRRRPRRAGGKLGLDGSPTRVMRIFAPPPREGGQGLPGRAGR